MSASPPNPDRSVLPAGLRVGTIDGSRTLDPSALEPLVATVADRLRFLGVGPGEVVLYAGPQQAAALALFWATARCGGVFAPVDENWPAFQLTQVARLLTPRVVVTTAAGLAAATTAFPAAESISSSWKSLSYQSRVNPTHSALSLELLKE